jgi:hypothetical protein
MARLPNQQHVGARTVVWMGKAMKSDLALAGPVLAGAFVLTLTDDSA